MDYFLESQEDDNNKVSKVKYVCDVPLRGKVKIHFKHKYALNKYSFLKDKCTLMYVCG